MRLFLLTRPSPRTPSKGPRGIAYALVLVGGIAGVASRSPQAPLKQVDFPVGLEKFEGARRYDEWVFEYAPRPAAGNRPSAPAALLHPR